LPASSTSPASGANDSEPLGGVVQREADHQQGREGNLIAGRRLADRETLGEVVQPDACRDQQREPTRVRAGLGDHRGSADGGDQRVAVAGLHRLDLGRLGPGHGRGAGASRHVPLPGHQAEQPDGEPATNSPP